MLFKRYGVMQNDTTDCGVACLASIAKWHGVNTSFTKIREATKTDKNGTSVFGLIKGAEKLGFSAKAFKSKNKDIMTEFPKPAIAHVMTENSCHYVVISKIRNKIHIFDPSYGYVRYTIEDFLKIWTGVLIILVPKIEFIKNKDTKGIYSGFFSLIFYQKKLLRNIFISSTLISILGIVGSFYYKFIIDDIIPSSLFDNLNNLSVAFIILIIFKVIVEYFRKLLLLYMSQNIDIPLLLGYYRHLIELPMEYFSNRKIGDIVSRFNDACKIREAISQATVTIMMDLLMAIAGGIILYIQSHKLFYMCLLPILIYLLLVFLFRKRIEKVNRNVMENNSHMTSYIVESIEGIETVKVYNAEEEVNKNTESNFLEYLKSIFSYGHVNAIQTSMKGIVKSIFSIVILWNGAYLVLKGNISIGTLICFNSLLIYFIEPIERIINLQPEIQSAMVAADRLSEVLELEIEKVDEEKNKIIPKSLFGDIVISDVNFRYGSRKLVLKDINMKIKRGEKVALVGESGSGKTSIAKILNRLYQIESGEIIINNYNIKDISLIELRKKIAYISQDSFFFSGSIKENLKIGNQSVSYEEIIDVCKKVHIHNYINSLPMRYETILVEKGMNLSGGQKQRLAIARALLKKPEILIMDEATSNLDTITEQVIQQTINECTKDITVIVIAHRLSTIKSCDKIYVMEKGMIVEKGSHQKLISNKGYYYNLWKNQFADKKGENNEN